jgi:hypothetical protein
MCNNGYKKGVQLSIRVEAREQGVRAAYVSLKPAPTHVAGIGAPPSFVYWLVPVIALFFLESLSRAGLMPANVLPTPSQVGKVAWDLTRTGELPTHLLVSLRRVAIGLAISGTAGLALGFVVGLSRWAAALFDGSLQMVRTIPSSSRWAGVTDSGALRSSATWFCRERCRVS